MDENKNLLLKGAMTYGLILGIYWVVKYIFFIFSVSFHALNLVYWSLTFAVPFIAYQMTKRYQQDIGERISFFHAWRFGTMLYFFAALIVSLEHFVFYQFIAPPDFIANAIGQLTAALQESQVNSEMLDSLGKIRISPIHMAIQGIFNNVFYGIILSIPVAALLSRNNQTGSAPGEPLKS